MDKTKPLYEKMVQERDIMVPMRDGVKVAVDIYRPDAQGNFPASHMTRAVRSGDRWDFVRCTPVVSSTPCRITSAYSAPSMKIDGSSRLSYPILYKGKLKMENRTTTSPVEVQNSPQGRSAYGIQY